MLNVMQKLLQEDRHDDSVDTFRNWQTRYECYRQVLLYFFKSSNLKISALLEFFTKHAPFISNLYMQSSFVIEWFLHTSLTAVIPFNHGNYSLVVVHLPFCVYGLLLKELYKNVWNILIITINIIIILT